MKEKFCNLHQHTKESHLDAICDIDTLFDRIKELGQSAVAVTDHGSMGGIFEAYKASKRTGVKLIPGNEIYFTPDLDAPDKDPETGLKNPQARRYHLVLLASNEIGYRNLLRITYEGFKNSKTIMNKEFPRVDAKILREFSEGLFALSACGGNIIAQSIFTDDHDNAISYAKLLQDIYKDRFFIELQPHGIKRGKFSQVDLNREIKKVAEELGIPMVATCDAHYIKKEDEKYHDMVLAISDKKPLEDISRHTYTIDILCEHCDNGWVDKAAKLKCENPLCSKGVVSKLPCQEFYVKSEREVRKFFTKQFGAVFAEDLINNTARIAAQCEMPAYIEPTGKEHIPDFSMDHIKQCDDFKEFEAWRAKRDPKHQLKDWNAYMRFVVGKAHFQYMKEKNFSKEQQKEYLDRMKFEVEVLETKNFVSYMLIVGDYINWARKNNILVGPARGCLTADTLVLIETGLKPIAEIKPGTKVYDHNGDLKEVTAFFEYEVTEPLLQLQTEEEGHPLTMTADHKVLVSKVADQSKVEWVPASDVKVGDLVVLPKISAPEIREDRSVYDKKELAFLETIPLHQDDANKVVGNVSAYNLGRLTGLYFSKGVDYKEPGLNIEVNLYQHCEEEENFLDAVSQGGLDRESLRSDGCIKIAVKDSLIAILVKNSLKEVWQYSTFHNIPQSVMFASESFKLGFVRGVTAHNKVRNGFVKVYTGRRGYAENLFKLCLNLGISCSFEVANTFLYCVKIEKTLKISKDKYTYKRITSIKESSGHTKVYDFTVPDTHSYVTNSFVVHNSAAGSLVGFYLGVQRVDPIKYGLFFERFQNLQKKSLPDIDTDFAPSGRDKVFKYCQEKYGESAVAYISNLNRFTPKVAMTDVIRSLMIGGDKSEAFRIAKLATNDIPDKVYEGDKIKEVTNMDLAIKHATGKNILEILRQYPEVKEYCDMIVGLPRNYSTHAGGVVISDRPLYEIVPIRRDKKGSYAVQYEKKQVEENGLVKMDMLGLTTLEIIGDVIEQAGRLGIELPSLDDLCEDPTDPNVYKLISSGLTKGCFQIEGRTLQPLCKPMAPKSVEDIALINALGRPSSSEEERVEFIERRHNRRPIRYPHPLLKDILQHTYGISIYEEDLLRLAQYLANWDLSEADDLRKLTKLKAKGGGLAEKLEQKFIKGCQDTHNLPESEAKMIWEEVVLPYSKYGFCIDGEQLVQTENGNIKMKDLRSGDRLASLVNNQKVFAPCKTMWCSGEKEVFEVELEDGTTIRATSDHSFLHKGEWFKLSELVEKGVFQTYTGSFKTLNVKSVKSLGKRPVYDLEMEGEPNFILPGGVVAHNCKAHAIAYSMIGYATAYYKYYARSAFFAATLNSKINSASRDKNFDEKIKSIKQDAETFKVVIEACDINASKENYVAKTENSIATGLGAVKGVGQAALKEIIANQPYSSFKDFAIRSPSVVNKGVVIALAKAGAFDSLGVARKFAAEHYPGMRLELRKFLKKCGDECFVDGDRAKPFDHILESFTYSQQSLETEEWSVKSKMEKEKEVLGEFISGTIHNLFPGFFEDKYSSSSTIMKSFMDKKDVFFQGVTVGCREFVTKNGASKGKSMAYLTIEDVDGMTVDVTFFADAYEPIKNKLGDVLNVAVKGMFTCNDYKGKRSLIYKKGTFKR